LLAVGRKQEYRADNTKKRTTFHSTFSSIGPW
jgi:hypothetical protein